jgi:protein O-GlcNAc transferase
MTALETAHRQLQAGDARAALLTCQRLIQDHPGDADAFNLAGLAAAAQGALSTAVRLYLRALAIDPGFVAAHNNLGGALAAMGRAPEALAAFEQALLLDPHHRAAWDNLLLAALCVPGLPPAALADLHRSWGLLFQRDITPFPRRHPPPAAGRRLRLGYVSADFRQSAVAWFLRPLLAHHDRTRVMVHAYASHPGADDAVTAELRAHVDVWRPIAGLDDDQVARQVADDQIDVLVDLGGHTAGHRLGVFARRPATVQVSYLGYPATTGLATIDHRLTDADADPPGASEALHTEALVRLPGGFLCFGGPAAPLPAPAPPSHAGGGVTFGSFNDAGKLSPPVLALWGRLLARVPGSRLVLKGRAYLDPEVRQRVTTALAAAGAPGRPPRVQTLGWVPDRAAHLDAYSAVDVALDPFPYNGTTTTCEALWMGVPVVTLRGDAHVARMGASLLTRVGLPALIAASEADYLEIAARLAADRDQLQALRTGLRARLAASPLGDATAHTRAIEACYQRLYEAAARA